MTDKITSLRKALTALQLQSIAPTGIVMHPTDAEGLDLAKDGQSRYYFAGPQESGASPVWSIPSWSPRRSP